MSSKPNARHPLPFRYPGGKHYAINLLRPFWDCVPHNEYREPFAGGGSVFFNKPKAKKNWLNDIDKELITTYDAMKSIELRDKLVSRVCNEVATKERWREVFEFSPKNKLDVAYKYYYLNRTSFSGKLVSPAWGYRPKRSLPPERWHERIYPCGEKLRGVKTTSYDFDRVIKAPQTNGGDVLMFVDPPYYMPPKKKHYRNGFTIEDHNRLCESLQKTDHYFFLTYDDVPEIRQMYSWAHIYEAEFYYRVDNSNVQNGNRKIGFELIITNYAVDGWVED